MEPFENIGPNKPVNVYFGDGEEGTSGVGLASFKTRLVVIDNQNERVTGSRQAERHRGAGIKEERRGFAIYRYIENDAPMCLMEMHSVDVGLLLCWRNAGEQHSEEGKRHPSFCRFLIFQQRVYPERHSSQTAKTWSPVSRFVFSLQGSGEPIHNRKRA